MTMKTVILDAATLGGDTNLSPIQVIGETCIYKSTDVKDVASRIEDADIVLVNKIKLNKSNLENAKNLKLICVFATGYDNIDTDYCKTNNIAVCNVPGYSTDSVAQLTVSMALSLATHLFEYNNFVKTGGYTASGVANSLTPVWHEICGLEWGIVGAGAIGSRVADIANAFGCNVKVFRQKPDAKYQNVDIDTLCESCDVISIHLPLTDQTRGIINKQRIEKMKKTAIVINVARGAIADENALADAVVNKKIAGLGVDVYSKEPFSNTHPFWHIKDFENVLLTPHMAWGSYEARNRCAYIVAQNIKAFLNGETKNRIV